MDNWVDFKVVKRAVSAEQIIAHYGLNLARSGQHSFRGRCPLPCHTSKKSANTFTITTKGDDKMWDCLSTSCVAARGGVKGGNLLDLVALMEGCTTREAALKMADWFHITETSEPPVAAKSAPTKPAAPPPEPKPQLVAEEETPAANTPLTFTLSGVSYCDYLGTRGITKETAALFGVGLFPGRGTMAGRVVIPIHNADGELVAYAGRAPNDQTEPKYKLPPRFHKSLELYNTHRVLAQTWPDEWTELVILVEGFFDAINLWQAGYPAVALMGSSMSEAQATTIRAHWRKVILMLDGDEAGRAGTADILPRLAEHIFVRNIRLGDGLQPDKLAQQELWNMLPL